MIEGVFGPQPTGEEAPSSKDPRYVFQIPVHMRIIHAFIITMIMPRLTNWDRVMCADAEILYEVINRRLVDTPQLLLYAMQCSSGNTKDPVVLPHLVRPILDYLHLECPPVDDEERIGRIFVPNDLQKLVFHADLNWKTPPPSP